MKPKFDKYWSECNLLMSVVVVLDPRLKMKCIDFIFLKIYSSFELEFKIMEVECVVWEIYNQYVTYVASYSLTSTSASRSSQLQKSHLFHLHLIVCKDLRTFLYRIWFLSTFKIGFANIVERDFKYVQ